MIKLENIHKEMNNQDVQSAVNILYREWMWMELDGLENRPDEIRESLQRIFWRKGIHPTEEKLLAGERLFQIKTDDEGGSSNATTANQTT